MNFDLQTLETVITTSVGLAAIYFALKAKVEKLDLLVDRLEAENKEMKTELKTLHSEIEEMKAVREYKEKQKLNQ